MRFATAACAVVALAIPGIVGCKTGGGPGARPSWSLSSWNPFKSSSESPPYPEPPSQYADPTPVDSPAAGYAANGPGAMVPGAQPTSTQGDYGGAADYAGAGYPTGRTDYGAMGAPGATGNSYTIPQQGHYNPATAYAGTGQQQVTPADPSQYVDQANPYSALDRSGYPRSSGSYAASGDTGGYYGSGAGSASSYVAELDRQTGSLGDRSFQSYYNSGGNAGSTAAGPMNEPQYNPYGGKSYTPADDASASNSAANEYGGSANPLGTADYTPGRTGYTPGDTGYSPGGVAPYQSPGGTYVPPGGSSYASPASPPYGSPSGGATGTGTSPGSQGYTPYLPGSIKPYTGGTMGASSSNPAAGQVGDPTGTDDGVQAAGYLQTPETRRL
jgi:hypothetical protein